jgi:hypothetical protein
MATPPPDDGWPEPTLVEILGRRVRQSGGGNPLRIPSGTVADVVVSLVKDASESLAAGRGPVVVRWEHEPTEIP